MKSSLRRAACERWQDGCIALWFAVLLSPGFALAQRPVLEAVDPDTGDYVFVATDENNIFPAPASPREFASFGAFHDWLAERLKGSRFEEGVTTQTRVEGVAVFQTAAGLREVTDATAALVFGEFGFIVIDGKRLDGIVQPGFPKDPGEYLPILFSQAGWRWSCGAAPLGPQVCASYHSSSGDILFAQFGGGTITGNSRASPSTIDLTLSFRRENGAAEPIPPPGVWETYDPRASRAVSRSVRGPASLSWNRWNWGLARQPLDKGHYSCVSGSVDRSSFGSLAISRFPWFYPRLVPFCP